MREIKFRAWNKKTNEMLPHKANDGKVYAIEALNYPYIYDIMQYTGLKDKNDVEIYEGDIVKDGARLWKIKISPIYGIFFILAQGSHTRCYSDFGKHLIDEFEVIGNIYENHELFESKQ